MKKQIPSIILVAILSTFISVTATAAADENCAPLKESLISQVCVGDQIQARWDSDPEKTVPAGTVIQIEPGMADDGAAMSILTLQTSQGPLKVTSRGIVFTQTGKCTTANEKETPICVGEKIKTSVDGRFDLVVGIRVGDSDMMAGSALVIQGAHGKALADSNLIYYARKLAATGRVSTPASCYSEIPFLHKVGFGYLPSCASKKAEEILTTQCQKYCNGKGSLDQNELRQKNKPSCDLEYNLFPPHKKVCSVVATTTCRCSN